jgi:TRAP-type C4-dicarboxylate transport system substrate-binding protein
MMVDGVKLGQADMGVMCMAYQPGRFVVTNATSLPLQLPNSYVAGLTLFDLYKKYKPKAFDKLKVITMFTSAPSNLMMKVPVRKLDDLKGVNVRASGMAAQVLKIWGANPVGMPMPETPEALQKGVVKGLFSSLEVMKDFKFAESCKYATVTDAVIYPFAVIMNEKKWNSLPEDVKKVMEDMSLEQSKWTGKYMDDHVMESIEWSKKNQNVEFITLSEEQKAKWNAMLDPMVKDWVKDATAKGFPGAQIIDDIKTFRDKYAQ